MEGSLDLKERLSSSENGELIKEGVGIYGSAVLYQEPSLTKWSIEEIGN